MIGGSDGGIGWVSPPRGPPSDGGGGGRLAGGSGSTSPPRAPPSGGRDTTGRW